MIRAKDNIFYDVSDTNFELDSDKPVPPAPTSTALTPTNGGVSVAFTPGADNGVSITSYSGEWRTEDTFDAYVYSVPPGPAMPAHAHIHLPCRPSRGGPAGGGDRSASASLEDLITVYANIPLGGNGIYALAGYHTVDVTTTETLPNSSYGDVDLNGYQVGLGKKGDNYKFEFFYSDFEDISLTATGGSASHTIAADADAMGLKFSIFY
mgnify:CR=1 FL=1